MNCQTRDAATDAIKKSYHSTKEPNVDRTIILALSTVVYVSATFSFITVFP